MSNGNNNTTKNTRGIMPEQFIIQVQGLQELNRALKRVDANLPKQLKGRFKVIAERVASIIRGRLPSVSGTMRSKTKAHATQRGAGITWRGVPYAGPVEFGAWPRGRPYIQRGRYIFPVVVAEESRIANEVEQVLADVMRGAGLG